MRQSRSGEEGFHATVFAAVTGRPLGFEHIVSPFPSYPLGAAVQAPVHDDAAADSRAQDDTKDRIMPVPGAINGLAQGKAIGIVVDTQFALQQ